MKKGQHFGLGVHRFDMSWMLFVKSLKSYVWSLLVLLLYEYRHKHVGARTAVSSPPSPGCVCLTPWWALITVNSAVAGTGTSPPAAQTNSRGWWTTKCGVSTLGFVQRQSGLSFALKLHRQLNYTFSFLSLHYLQVILISVRVICHFSFLSNPVKFFFFFYCAVLYKLTTAQFPTESLNLLSCHSPPDCYHSSPLQMILTVYLSDGEQAVTEVPITPETTCRDVVEFCKEPGESGCHLAEVWRGNGKTWLKLSYLL